VREPLRPDHDVVDEVEIEPWPDRHVVEGFASRNIGRSARSEMTGRR
jgi:hypothetical protein